MIAGSGNFSKSRETMVTCYTQPLQKLPARVRELSAVAFGR